ncbi:hypothetical protein BDK51DRAFT_43771 [Blyttiomyces helicus]|uniref:Uncharacterized protein n=1 Tax=Blyttiomyces helicus TaxID=388810 RepID=A0A4V1IRR6_9FUNG|nr:hypothetical protein BDK51DRAFT_43771 [Blyttiomyces helicus]|eukprot:RKO90987.1 hypothetical protein BDK51DRAFT_43771 [Blyttiomyces helicus]
MLACLNTPRSRTRRRRSDCLRNPALPILLQTAILAAALPLVAADSPDSTSTGIDLGPLGHWPTWAVILVAAILVVVLSLLLLCIVRRARAAAATTTLRKSAAWAWCVRRRAAPSEKAIGEGNGTISPDALETGMGYRVAALSADGCASPPAKMLHVLTVDVGSRKSAEEDEDDELMISPANRRSILELTVPVGHYSNELGLGMAGTRASLIPMSSVISIEVASLADTPSVLSFARSRKSLADENERPNPSLGRGGVVDAVEAWRETVDRPVLPGDEADLGGMRGAAADRRGGGRRSFTADRGRRSFAADEGEPREGRRRSESSQRDTDWDQPPPARLLSASRQRQAPLEIPSGSDSSDTEVAPRRRDAPLEIPSGSDSSDADMPPLPRSAYRSLSLATHKNLSPLSWRQSRENFRKSGPSQNGSRDDVTDDNEGPLSDFEDVAQYRRPTVVPVDSASQEKPASVKSLKRKSKQSVRSDTSIASFAPSTRSRSPARSDDDRGPGPAPLPPAPSLMRSEAVAVLAKSVLRRKASAPQLDATHALPPAGSSRLSRRANKPAPIMRSIRSFGDLRTQSVPPLSPTGSSCSAEYPPPQWEVQPQIHASAAVDTAEVTAESLDLRRTQSSRAAKSQSSPAEETPDPAASLNRLATLRERETAVNFLARSSSFRQMQAQRRAERERAEAAAPAAEWMEVVAIPDSAVPRGGPPKEVGVDARGVPARLQMT